MSTLAGLGACLGATLCFGSVFVPIKKFPPGDGFAVQLYICLGGFLVSTVVHAVEGFPAIQPFAMLGGMIWCSANSGAIPIMNKLGMALSILIWNTMSCLTGWATSRYGLFGLPANPPESRVLNYTGIVILILGGIVYLFVVPEQNCSTDDLETKGSYCPSTGQEKVENNETTSTKERVVCTLGAIFSGLFYGSMITPITYILTHRDEFTNASDTALPYLFSFFLGVLCTSSMIFVIYALARRNRPSINAELVVPGILAGVIFGLAMTFFLLANQLLSQSIAYPFCAMAPGLVVSLWSVLYFKEITGRRNLYLLSFAYCLTLIGVACVTVSKDFSF